MGISTKDWYCVLFPTVTKRQNCICYYSFHNMLFYSKVYLRNSSFKLQRSTKGPLRIFGHSVIVTGPLKVMPPISKPLLLGSPPIPPLLLPYLFGHISQKVHNLFAPSYRNANPRSATDCEIFRGPPPFRTFQFFVSQILNFARGQWLDDSSIMEISSKQFLFSKTLSQT